MKTQENSKLMNNLTTKITTALLLMTMLTMLTYNIYGQSDEGFIYGKVTTIEDKTYEGQIRWGKEEAFWTDHFNVSKKENNNLDFLTRDQIEDLKNQHNDWNLSKSFFNGFDFNDDKDEHLHQFVCQFGNLSSIEISGREKAYVTLRNGKQFKISGEGYNDIGTKVRVQDDELGMVSIRWSEIEKIDFQATPKSLGSKMGEPLYGEVETSDGKFTGFVQWDHDERLSTDKLDGDSDDSDLSIEFGKIVSIENRGSSSAVVLKSGRKFDLRGSNDVNRENRGIIVTLADGSRVDVPWDEFDKVTFISKAPNSGVGYNSFSNPKELNGSVKTQDGKTFSGRIIYDLDEAYGFEIIQGKDDDLEYFIALSNIKSIRPRNYDNSSVVLKNGQKLLLGDAQDVSDRNDGILVFEGKGSPKYVAWEDVEEITLN